MKKSISPKFLELAKKLKKGEAEKLQSRMTGKLPNRVAQEKLSKEVALAIQMELEAEQLSEWRSMMRKLREQEAAKIAKAKAKALEQKTKIKAKAEKLKAKAAKKKAKADKVPKAKAVKNKEKTSKKIPKKVLSVSPK